MLDRPSLSASLVVSCEGQMTYYITARFPEYRGSVPALLTLSSSAGDPRGLRDLSLTNSMTWRAPVSEERRSAA
jgi:hypothetical protein